MEVLDRDFEQSLQRQFYEEEQLLWRGNPIGDFRITYLSRRGGTTDLIYFSSLLLIVLATLNLICFIYQAYAGVFLTAGIFILLFFLPDYLRIQRLNYTRYAFSRKRIFFQLWRNGKKELYSLAFEQIQEIHQIVYKGGKGVIYFIPKEKVGFYTFDFIVGKRRFYPTFELLLNIERVYKQLESLRRKNYTIK